MLNILNSSRQKGLCSYGNKYFFKMRVEKVVGTIKANTAGKSLKSFSIYKKILGTDGICPEGYLASRVSLFYVFTLV